MTLKRVCDLLLYVAIAVAFGFATIWVAGNSPRGSSGVIAKWFGLAANTLVVFGYTIRQLRPSWLRRSFWLILVALLSAHLLLFVSALGTMQTWRTTWWIVVTPVEYMVIGAALALMGYRPTDVHDRQDHNF